MIVDERPDSVVTGRSLDEIKVAKDRVWHSNQSVAANVKGGAIGKPKAKVSADLTRLKGARERAIPATIEAQLATLVSAKALRRSINEADHRNLVDEAVAELGGVQQRTIA